jgi:putative hydrolase of the HAD superfamily
MPQAARGTRANRFQFVFLDVGETLLRVTRPGETYRAILLEHGYDLPAEMLDTSIRELFKELDAVLPRQRNPDHTISAELAHLRRERLLEGLLQRAGVEPHHGPAVTEAMRASWIGPSIFQLYPDVPAVLETLRAEGYRLGIVSNWEPRLLQLCGSHGIDHHFEFAVISESEGYVKPHPRLFERALELAGVGPDAVVHVGDSYPEDVEGARGVGIEAVLVDRQGHGRVPYSPTIRSLAELPPLLAALEATP